MVNYEKGFFDRKGANTSRKTLEVISNTIHANGNMTLTANINRDDLGITQTGTILNADAINKAVLDLVYNDLFGIQISEDLHTIDIVGNEQFEFTITCNERPLFANCICDNGIDFNGSNDFYDNGAEITIILVPNTTVLTAESEFNFKIELYTDLQRRNYLTSVTGRVHYTPTSQSTGD